MVHHMFFFVIQIGNNVNDGNVPDMTLIQIFFYQQKIKDGHQDMPT
jgi:hypothetical protein